MPEVLHMRGIIAVHVIAFAILGTSGVPLADVFGAPTYAAMRTPEAAEIVANAGRSVDRASPPRQTWREITLPAGTRLPVVLDTAVGSNISRVEQPVRGHLATPITIRGQRVLAQGSRVNGVVTNAVRSARVKGRARIGIRFDTLTPRGQDQQYAIRTASVGRIAPATKKKDALEIGGGAAGGALIGSLVGGSKGALIGTAAGGGAGSAVVLSTRGKEVRLPKGSVLTLRLSEPLTVRVTG
jgi:hypothetical protein